MKVLKYTIKNKSDKNLSNIPKNSVIIIDDELHFIKEDVTNDELTVEDLLNDNIIVKGIAESTPYINLDNFSSKLKFLELNDDYTAVSNYFYICDSSEKSFEITLPDSPNDGDEIKILDKTSSFKDNNIIIKSNKLINGEDIYICNKSDSLYTLQYYSNLDEWVMIIEGSKNLNSLFAEFMCDIPILTNQSNTEINERDYIEIDIDNYDENADYFADNELVTKIRYKSDKTFKIYFGNVDEDTDIEFRIRAVKTGYISSNWSNVISITIKDLPEEEDDSIINDAFADNEESSSDCDVTNDKVTFTADGGVYKEVITEQGDDEENWSSYQTITRIALDKMTIIDDDTNTDTLSVEDEEIKDVSKCYIINDDYPDGVEIDIGDVTDDSKDTTNTLDIFDDDSCELTYNFDNENLNDLSGNYDGEIVDGSEEYTDDEWDAKAFVFNKVNTFKSGWKTKIPMSISFRMKFNTLGDNWMSFTGSPDGSDNGDNWAMKFKDDDEDNLYFHGGYCATVATYDLSNTDDKWFNFVIVVPSTDINDMQFYMNNEKLDMKVTNDTKDLKEECEIAFGKDFYNNDYYFDGDGNQIRIFNKVLTDEEIDELYNEKIDKYKADISSNDLDNAPTSAYFIEPNITISTTLTEDDPVDPDDFNDETLDTWKIDDDNDYKENIYKKVSDYTGTKFQRKVTGDEDANIIYLESKMWKDS